MQSSRSDGFISYSWTLLFASGALLLVAGIITYPEQAFQASLQGLSVWWEIVFPSLLPFLILTEIMLALGLMHFVGYWLEPIMRRVFQLPGSCGPVLCLSFTAGYAAGANATAKLRQKQWISQHSAEQLLALCFTASPVLIISVIASGFFHNLLLGWMLLIIYLLSWIATIIIFRIFIWHSTTSTKQTSLTSSESKTFRKSFSDALQAMQSAKKEDGRGFGKLLGDAVTDSIQILFLIGGYIMLFAVISALASASSWVSYLIELIPMLASLAKDILHAAGIGFLDMHLGAYVTSKLELSVLWQTAVLTTLLAWGGWSTHSQVVSIVQQANLSIRPYITFRTIQGFVALFLTFLLWQPLSHAFRISLPSITMAQPSLLLGHFHESPPPMWSYSLDAAICGLTLLMVFFVCSWMLRLRKN